MHGLSGGGLDLRVVRVTIMPRGMLMKWQASQEPSSPRLMVGATAI